MRIDWEKTGKLRRKFLSMLLMVSFFLLSPTPVQAETVLTVTNLNDSGAGSLREAISSSASGDKIVFQDGLSGTITLSAELYIDKALTIEGFRDNPEAIKLDGNNQNRIFKICGQSDTVIEISSLTIQNGKTVGQNGGNGSNGRTGGGGGGGGAAAGGAGMLILKGDVTVDNVIFDNNTAIGGNGGNGGEGWNTSLSGNYNTSGGSGGASELYITPYTPPGGPDFDLDGRESLYYSGAGGGAGGLLEGTGGNGGDGRGRGGAGGDGGWGGVLQFDGSQITEPGQGGQGGQGGSAMGAALSLTSGSLILQNATFTNNTVIAGNGGQGGYSGLYVPSENNPATPFPDWAKSYFGGHGGDSGYAYGPAVYIGGDIEDGSFDTGYIVISNCSFEDNDAIAGSVGIGGADANGAAESWRYGYGGGDVADVYQQDIFSHFNLQTNYPQPSDYIGYRDNLSDKQDYIYITGVTQNINYAANYVIPDPNPYDCDVYNSTGSYLNANGEQATITVTLRSGPDAPVFGETVWLDQNGGSSVISPSIAITDRDGKAVFTVSGTKAETVVYTPKFGGSNIPLDSVTITYVTGASDANGSTITANKTEVYANGTDSAIITVTICDAYGNPIFAGDPANPFPAGKAVVLTENSGSSTIESTSEFTDPTIGAVNSVIDVNGRATFRVKNNTAETVTYTATNVTDNYTLTQTITIDFISYNWVVNSLSDTDTPGTLRHAIANAPSGETIIFDGSLDGGTITLTSYLPTIDKNLTISGAGVDITINGNNAHRIFTINSGEVEISSMTLINGKSQGAEGEDGRAHTIIIDGYTWEIPDDNGGTGGTGNGGAILANSADLTVYDVTFSNNSAIGGNGGVGGTHSDGSRYSSGGGGPAYGGAISINSGTLDINNSTFNSNRAIGGHGTNGGSSTYESGGNGGHGGASYGGAIHIGAAVTADISGCTFSDSNTTSGNGARGGTGSSNTYSGSGGNGANALGGAIFLNDAGSLTLSNSIFTNSTANAGNGNNAGIGSSSHGNHYGGNGGSAFGGSIYALNGILNADNCSFNNGNVTYGTLGTGAYANGTDGTSDGADIYSNNSQAYVINSSFSEGTNTFYNNAPSSAVTSTIATSSSSVVSDGETTSTITVTLSGANGSSAGSGKTVVLTSDSGTAIISPSSAVTDGFGRAVFTVADNIAETVTYTATDTTSNVTVAQTAAVIFLCPDAGRATVRVSDDSVTANGIDESTITVALYYADDTPAANKTVTLSQGSGRSVISPASAVTNAGGLAVFTVKNSYQETVTYTVVDTTDNLTVSQTGIITFDEYPWTDAARSTVAASPESVLSDGTTVSTITVTLNGADGGPTGAGKTVVLSADDGNSVISPASAVTDGSGRVVFTVTDNIAETVTYTAKDMTCDVTVAQTAVVTFLCPDAGRSTVTVSDDSVRANGVDESTITVALYYADGTPAANKTVTLSQGSGRSVISPVSAVTNAGGLAVFTIKNSYQETVTYTVVDTTDNLTVTQTGVITFNEFSWIVNTLSDTTDIGTLRSAIENAPNGAVITFQEGLNGVIELQSTLPAINKDLTIDGSGAIVSVSGSGLHRVFEVNGGTVVLKDIVVTNGKVVGNDGANAVTAGYYYPGGTGENAFGSGLLITNGTISIDNVTFSNNNATGGNGGRAIDTYAGAFAGPGGPGGSSYGGAIYLSSGSLTISNSCFDGNTIIGGNGANGAQGGIGGIGGNGGSALGGAIFNDNGSLTITNSTFTGNSTTSGVGGLKGNSFTTDPYFLSQTHDGRNGSALGVDIYNQSGSVTLSNLALSHGNNSYYNAFPVSASISDVTASPASVMADGLTYSTITVTLKDSNGSSAGPGHAVTLTSGTGSSVISPAGNTTDYEGKAVFTVTNTQVETVSYTAVDTSSGVTMAQTVTVDFVPLANVETYTVTYDGNGGTGTAPTESDKVEGAPFTAATNSFTLPAGKQFKEWNTKSDGTGTGYAQGATVTVPANNLILYAIWEDITNAPTITAQPISQMVEPGQAGSFSVTASGTGLLTYQWQINGSDISGATATTLNIANVQWMDIGSYTVVVSDSAGHSVTSNTADLKAFGITAITQNFDGPSGVAVDSSGNIYVADTFHNVIKKMNAAGNNLVTLGSGFNHPYGVAVDSSGNIYVADANNNAIKKMDAAGNNLVTLGSGFNYPYGVAVDGSGNIYVGDMYNYAIKKMDADGNNLVTLAQYGLYPRGITVDSSGNIYIADNVMNVIKKMDAAGNNIVTLGSGFNHPSGIAVDSSGNIYVADAYNSAIKKMDADGNNIVTIGSGFSLPQDVAVDSNGNIYVADMNNSAIKKLEILSLNGVAYNGNSNTGGSAPADGNSYEQGDTVTVLGNTGGLVRTGYSFEGWNTSADGSGTSYAVGATVTMPEGNLVLYAVWEDAVYSVNYDNNGGTGTAPTESDKAEGATFTSADNTFTAPSGKQFKEWNTVADGSGTSYAAGATVTMPSNNLTLYAIWEDIPVVTYTLTYDGNSGTGTAPTDGNSYESGDTVTVLNNTGSLEKTGHTFGGWNTQTDGSGTTYAAGDTFSMGSTNVTLYAKWIENSSAGDGNEGGSSGGSGSSSRADSNPPKAEQPDTNTSVITSDSIVKETTTTDSGETVETFTVQSSAGGQIEEAKTQGKTTVQFNIESSQTSVTEVSITSDVLNSAADLNVSITTPNASLELPSALVNALAQAGQNLSLTVTRGGEVRNPVDTTVLGTPTTINTDIVGTTQVTIPFSGIEIPSDPEERDSFLSGLAVFTLHSDGEEQLINGEIIYDEDGNPVGITFPVDKFSTFAVIKMEKKTVLLTIGREKASINGITTALDAGPYIDPTAGRTLAPLRFISEALGAKIEWQPSPRRVIIRDGSKEIILTIDSKEVIMNGKTEQNDCAPVIVPPGRTFLPLRFIGEALGAEVAYDDANRQITIIRKYDTN